MLLKSLQVIWALTTLLFVSAGIPYLIWMGILAYRKQWRKTLRRTLIPIGAYVLLTGLVAIVSNHHYTTEHHRIFGAKFVLETPLYEYHSPRHFNGDGYSITVHPLPDAVRKRFDPGLNQPLPQLPDSALGRERWSTESWRRAPLATEFKEHVRFALSSYDQDKNRELMANFDAIEAALAGDSAYYAFRYYSPGGYVGNIDFYLVDLAQAKIYLINHNT